MGVERNVIKAGNGVIPKKGDKITVHCTGYVAEGKKKFWSTLDDNKPFAFNVGLGQVIRGWDEGMLQMSIGEQAELTMSSDYAYGPKGFPAWGIPANAALIFVIEMLKIN
ncbi:peptidyl-prolyl cis-trans isomerase, putative [Bodo saltans]|uniref:peptidylprolyl isomerase n=1 Tax=Bodo saltans TaxID=75058 RepID=A0A0S4KLH1_BODSA|nr:peptidyl-prolyl cis-trans isomerase, putative [Bodo saltans]|eukprot:CUI15252.1 peptidyl-prolyl cis-trans isomerase, putative [Bodo saltans]